MVGYRAPSYSITPRSLWALDVLIEEGYAYDASIFPIRTIATASLGGLKAGLVGRFLHYRNLERTELRLPPVARRFSVRDGRENGGHGESSRGPTEGRIPPCQ